MRIGAADHRTFRSDDGAAGTSATARFQAKRVRNPLRIGGGVAEEVDLTSNTVTSTIAVGALPNARILNATGTRLYVGNARGDSITRVDTATSTVLHAVADFDPHRGHLRGYPAIGERTGRHSGGG